MLKVLLIGCGNIAGGFDAQRSTGSSPLTHAGAFTRHGGFELAACIEPDDAKREEFMSRWGVRHGFQDTGQAAASGLRFDVVNICSPTCAHHADAMVAIALKPRLIFCEKPLCLSVPEAADLVLSCRNAGVLLAVNHNRRWDSAVIRLQDELARGEWGALRSATGHYNKGVLNNGSHLIDLLHCLVGPMALREAGAPIHDFWPQDPSIPAVLATASGAPVMLNCGHAADYSLFELQLVLERGVIAMEDGGLHWRRRRAAPSPEFSGYRALEAGSPYEGDYLRAMLNAAGNIYDAVTAGAPLASTGDTALTAQRMCAQIRRQAAQPAQ
jgi:predicted dehydrogenase